MPRRVLGHGLIVWLSATALTPAVADCRAAFPPGEAQTLTGHTLPGIKNDFSDPVQIRLVDAAHTGNQVAFGGGEIVASRLAGGGLDWSATSDGRWGSQCLNLPDTLEPGGSSALLILSWDPGYKHPNLHGLISKVGQEWVFRGFLDNAAQQFHEAAIELRWSRAR